MKRLTKSVVQNVVLVLLVAAAAVTCQWAGKITEDNRPLHLLIYALRTLLYVGLYVYWIFSVRWRILNRQTRRLLITIGSLTIFWLVVRFLKWYVFTDAAIARHLWYLYYLPETTIPTLTALVAVSTGRAENRNLPSPVWYVMIVPTALSVGVLTNDLHQLAFRFLTPVWNEVDIQRGPLYWMCLAWDAVVAVYSIYLLIKKSRRTQGRRFMVLPFVPIMLALVYTFAYIAQAGFVMSYIKDFTVVLCLLFVGTLECCIQCGLIRSNTNYDALFKASSLNAFITDEDYNTVLSSFGCRIPDEGQMRATESGPVALSGGLRLFGAPIKNGRVLWSEDVAQLTDVVAQLEDTSERLSSHRAVLQKEIETTRQRRSRVEKNRLYNRMMTSLEAEMRQYADLVEQLDKTDDSEQSSKIVSLIIIIGTYIKRRANMIFLNESQEQEAGMELAFCLEESMSALRLRGIQCGYNISSDKEMDMELISYLYERLFRIIIDNIYALSLLYVAVDGGCMTLRIAADAAPICGDAHLEADDDEWIITVAAPKTEVAER